MCGIVAYLGKKQAYPILLEGLRRLEYRGYDSAGVALLNGELISYKKKGKVNELADLVVGQETTATSGIGHTRWATHGEPNDVNAHPHMSGSGRIALVHNGIIENHAVIKKALAHHGHKFVSDTDTEVLVHLIEEYKYHDGLSIEDAVLKAMNRIIGAYAIVVIDADEPDKLVAARKQSPLVIGIGEDEFLIASDASPIVKYTKKVVYLKDDEIGVVSAKDGLIIKNISNTILEPDVEEIDLEIEELEKGGYKFFMHKEIHQQPDTVSDCMRGRVDAAGGWVRLGGMEQYMKRIANAQRIIIAGCGTSWHAGLIGEYLIEELARIPVEVEYASELRYRNPVITDSDVVIAISQSGETIDTLAAIQHVKEKGALIYGIVNVVGSSIARATDAGSYIHAGPEIGVASTKAFTSQVTLLALMALQLGFENGSLSQSRYRTLVSELRTIPDKIRKVLKAEHEIEYIAEEIRTANNALYLGRGYNFPVALEGALKLKEISYIHAEGYPAAEMKHGPIALIDENMPVVVIATNQSAYDKILNNVQEVKARNGKVIAIVTEDDWQISELADYTVKIPVTEEPFTPLLSVIPLQLLSYHIAVMRGCNVDQPRNLAKSVTVE
ncbi:MAG TPA: glutamine--fructose-6-phosphate transaminase (isomerizing) [Saprospiraceae bacterium]|nr:glutamine--fructose-6-phosphate transaminase (isomerizing) [Saprospiraceae bacterium]